MYVFVLVEQLPPFASNVTVCVPAVHCAYNVRVDEVVTVLLAVTFVPPLLDVYQPANVYPVRVAVGRFV